MLITRLKVVFEQAHASQRMQHSLVLAGCSSGQADSAGYQSAWQDLPAGRNKISARRGTQLSSEQRYKACHIIQTRAKHVISSKRLQGILDHPRAYHISSNACRAFHISSKCLPSCHISSNACRACHISSKCLQGMPYHRNPYTKGGLYIEYNVIFPADNSLTLVGMQVLTCACPFCLLVGVSILIFC